MSNEIVIYTIFLRSVIFPYNSLYTQTVAYITYFQLGEPVGTTLEGAIRVGSAKDMSSIFRFVPLDFTETQTNKEKHSTFL